MALEMKTLTCKDENGNDVTFTVSDPDAINCCAQQLTDAQKAQARANIGAAGIDAIEAQAIFTPSVDAAGNISWTNDKGLANPATANIRGPQGVQGERGPQGERGEAGPQGVQGERGERGATGLQGSMGLRGPQGPQGERGPRGEQGARGVQGERGPQGIQGERGEKGEAGESGIIAPIGAFFALSVDEDGNLWVYSEDGGAPAFEYDEATGNLYVVHEQEA